MAAADDPPIDAVLFDMGGVFVQLGPLAELLGGAGMAAEDFWPRWLSSPAVRALESGRCTVERFAADLVDELGLDASPDEVVTRFAAFPRGLYPGAVEMVRSVPAGVTTAVLSNTNALHWDTQPDGPIIRGLFDRYYLSYELGATKPDREAYDLVVADLATSPERILFIDDNQVNVDGARAAGLRAEVAKGPEAATKVLQAAGLDLSPC